jgi:type IV secretory pathway VirB10-like protein
MNPLKDTFQDRVARAAEAKQKALDKLRAKPEIDPQVAAERQAARLAKEAKLAEQRAAKEEGRRQAAAEKATAAREEEAARRAKEEAARVVPPTEAELKAARDARYAARKSRKG